jgi:RhtB (resistance to homoserine/threonine) family protein
MPQHPLLFVGVVALLTITPGADMAMVARSVFTGGRRDAFATTLGISAGCLVWALASAIGVAAVLAASRTAYDALRLVGAAYLVWLGVQSLLAARRGAAAEPPPATGATRASPFRQGLLTNLFNPKIAVFYSTFLPQFIAPGDPVVALSLALAGVHIAFGLAWLSLYAWLLDRAVAAFKGSRLRRALDAVTGTVLVGLGLRLAAERR